MMPNKPRDFIAGSYYHIYNRGVEKRTIFLNQSFYYHFLKTIDFFRFYNKRKLSEGIPNKPTLPSSDKSIELVKILCFVLMPNHYHLVLQQTINGGISRFMNDIANSYTRYFNLKTKRLGHLFQGAFKAKTVESPESFLQVTRYIHLNPMEFYSNSLQSAASVKAQWLISYPYSSYKVYLGKSIIYDPCDHRLISEIVNSPKQYQEFVEAKIEERPGLGIANLILEDEFPTPLLSPIIKGTASDTSKV
ncbi:MAG: hypothetical protein UT37_C0023G0003 [Parcubacteria group bacterium GW2011_GWA2_39_18]|nr:MAG: hypothetical protein UT37_C0023G0003 [Parcubacteria group bacterium GW2011_GWA2_39_18]